MTVKLSNATSFQPNESQSSSLESNDVEFDTVDLDCEGHASTFVEVIGSLLLKLESIYNVTGKCLDDLVEQLQFICTSSSQCISNLVRSVLTQNNCTVDESVISELVEKLQLSNHLTKAFGPEGPFHSKYKKGKYFKENFCFIEPVENLLDPLNNCSFQYVPILQSLKKLLENKDIVSKILTTHSGNASQFSSFRDGKHFRLNEFNTDGDLRISLILYVDDFEICNPLGTSRKKHKGTAVYWVLADVPSELRS